MTVGMENSSLPLPQRLPIYSNSCQTFPMRTLTATICLTLAVLLGSAGVTFSVAAECPAVCNCIGYNGYGGPCYAEYGGKAYAGYGGPAYAGYGGPCYADYGGACYAGYGGGGRALLFVVSVKIKESSPPPPSHLL